MKECKTCTYYKGGNGYTADKCKNREARKRYKTYIKRAPTCRWNVCMAEKHCPFSNTNQREAIEEFYKHNPWYSL